jgi:hypothetical protein
MNLLNTSPIFIYQAIIIEIKMYGKNGVRNGNNHLEKRIKNHQRKKENVQA